MKNFSIDKKGYNIKEVDDYLITAQIESDRMIKEKQSRINELREENYILSRKLEEYKQKESYIASALTNANEKASEIENNAKKQYALEIENVKALYSKYEKFLNELIKRYPKMHDFDPNEVLKSMKKEIDSTLKNQFNIRSLNLGSGKDTDNSFRNLLSRIRSNIDNNKETEKTEKKIIKRNTKPNNSEILDSENELEFLSEHNRVNNIKPITNITLDKSEQDEFENLVDKFLNTQNTTMAKGYEKSIFNSKKKKDKSNSRYIEPNESGFDFEEALNPTEDLLSIMKGFNLD